jgi:hypothetical protein
MHSQLAASVAASLRKSGHEGLTLSAEAPPMASTDETAMGAARERLRRQLDQAVAQFDPHLIHAEGLTFWGQLACETGVPYVVTLVADDLDHADGSRLKELAEQGAQNARCVLVPAPFGEESKRLLEGLDNIAAAPWWPDQLAPLEALYRAALDRIA